MRQFSHQYMSSILLVAAYIGSVLGRLRSTFSSFILVLFLLCGTGTTALMPTIAAANSPITLRFHHFLPEQSPQHLEVFVPWAKRVEAASQGRLKIDVFGAMRLGGKPPDLLQQVENDTVDIVWTVAGYTAARFPRLEVFELPWITSSRGSASSQAVHAFFAAHAHQELSSVKPLALWCHPSGVIMTRDRAFEAPGELTGLALRVPSAVVGETFALFGANSKMIPAPAVIDALAAGSIEGALFPYELMGTLNLPRHIRQVTEFAGDRGLYTAVFLLLMSKSAYERLPADLRAVIDQHSGAQLAAEWGATWDIFEDRGRNVFSASGGNISFVKGANYDRWRVQTQPIIDSWIAKKASAGIDGRALITHAEELVAHYSRMAQDR
jgi:TRAP-type transport system periplasmic protein